MLGVGLRALLLQDLENAVEVIELHAVYGNSSERRLLRDSVADCALRDLAAKVAHLFEGTDDLHEASTRSDRLERREFLPREPLDLDFGAEPLE